MNAVRAMEIIESPQTINVICSGIKVYIQNINEENQTARVFPLDNPEAEQDVSLSDLAEID